MFNLTARSAVEIVYNFQIAQTRSYRCSKLFYQERHVVFNKTKMHVIKTFLKKTWVLHKKNSSIFSHKLFGGTSLNFEFKRYFVLP